MVILAKVSTINQAPKKAQQEKLRKKRWPKRSSEKKKKPQDQFTVLKKTGLALMLNTYLVKKKT